MRIDQLVEWLMPRDERFGPLFAGQLSNVRAAARALEADCGAGSPEERREAAASLEALEVEGDRLTREIVDALGSTFVTPLDREDLRAMATGLDEVLDGLDRVHRRLVALELVGSPEELCRLTSTLRGLVDELEPATRHAFAGTRGASALADALRRAAGLLEEADRIYGDAIARLLRSGSDPLETLRWKEVYDSLEAVRLRSGRYVDLLARVLSRVG